MNQNSGNFLTPKQLLQKNELLQSQFYSDLGDFNKSPFCKIVVVGDIHLHCRTYCSFNKKRFFKLIDALLSEDPDIVILNGDIFDKARATYEEIAIFYDGVSKLSEVAKVYVIAGNHEEISKDKTIFDYLPEYNFTYVKVGHLLVNTVDLFFVGHPYLKYIKSLQYLKSDRPVILISHYRSDVNFFMTSEVDNNFVSKTFDFAILSDIHMKFSPKENIMYTSSPYSVTFDSLKQYGYVVITVGDESFAEKIGKPFSVEWKELFLPQKIKLKGSAKELIDKVKNFDRNNLYSIEILAESDLQSLEELDKLLNSEEYSDYIVRVKYQSTYFDSDKKQEEIKKLEKLAEALQDREDMNLLILIEELLKRKGTFTDEHFELGMPIVKKYLEDELEKFIDRDF